MDDEVKIYLKTYLKFYLIFVVILVILAVIGVNFLNQDTFGFLWTFSFMSIGLFISFLVKRHSIRKQKSGE